MQIPDAVHALDRDLRSIFGDRLRSLVAYAGIAGDERAATLAVVDGLSADDLRACVGRVAAWDEAGLGTPLFVAAHEFERSLDAFPFEFGAILADLMAARQHISNQYEYYGSNWGAAMFGLENKDFLL